MLLKELYQPIEKQLIQIEDLLRSSLEKSGRESILEINNYVLAASGVKRLRPALVILSGMAASQNSKTKNQLIQIAAGIELIHIASLIHDDVIDHADFRHNKPTINTKFGENLSIILGDYLYSIAFQLVSHCRNINILDCISSATKEMCEGEMIQICERNNISLLKKQYILIIKKKTAALFAASSETGAIVSGCSKKTRLALRKYGLNFGIAFQITNDCLDLIGNDVKLGKPAGTDFRMGELTLPLLNLLFYSKDKKKIKNLLRLHDQESFQEIKKRFLDSPAFLKTKENIGSYLNESKKNLIELPESGFKQSLSSLVDYLAHQIPV